MVKTFTGDNNFELSRIVSEQVSSFSKQHGEMAIEKLDGEESSFDRIRESLESLPFLATKKLVVLKNPSLNKEFAEKYQELLQNVPETTEVIVFENKVDKRKAYYKFLKTTEFREISTLEGQTLVEWLIDLAKNQDAQISASDARYLIDRVGANQNLLYNEMNKLINHSQKINREDINKLCEPSPSSTIFDLLDAAFAGNHNKVLKLYSEQRQMKTEPIQIIAMLSWQLHVMSIVAAGKGKSDSEVAKDARISPFVVGKTRSLANKAGLKKIRSYITELLELDYKSKTSSINTDDALQAYLLTIS